MEHCDALVIGGGFYGLYLSEFLASRLGRIVLCEREAGLMRRASYGNQARVHCGYHYPRSMLTALRSRVNYPRFIEEFGAATASICETAYAVSRRFSKVTADQFYESMRRIGAPIRPAPKRLHSMFDASYIECVFLADERVFDANVLRNEMSARVRQAGIEVRLQTDVLSVTPTSDDAIRVELISPNGTKAIIAEHVFCCGYSQLNAPGARSGLTPVRLKHEIVELALVEVPEALRELGLTVMDGPFFSLMPFPARGLHSLSHVRYTPHAQWYDGEGLYRSPTETLDQFDRRSAFPHMIRDAARFLPAAAECRYQDSLWEIKSLLPRSEMDDSRPILFQPHYGMRNYHLVMGGKIDNVYEIADVVGKTFGWSKS